MVQSDKNKDSCCESDSSPSFNKSTQQSNSVKKKDESVNTEKVSDKSSKASEKIKEKKNQPNANNSSESDEFDSENESPSTLVIRNTRSRKKHFVNDSKTNKGDKANEIEDSNDEDSSDSVQMVRTRSKKANKISEDDDLDQKSEKSQSKLKKVKLKRKHISESSLSSDSDTNDDFAASKKKQTRQKVSKIEKNESPLKNKSTGRREIRTVFKKEQLTEETKDAEKQERERRKRLEKSKDNKIVEVDESMNEILPLPITKRLVFQKEPLVEVHPCITVHLKPHQVEGIQFVWDNLIESTEQAASTEGGGCILAHCMGLGKTLQTIAVLHTILTSEHIPLKTALIVAPLNTLLNWIGECNRWIPDDAPLQLYNLNEYQTIRARLDALKQWRKTGGILVLGYDMFRLLASGIRIRYKAWKVGFAEHLLDPGPDIVVCDEGHKLKNSESNISVIMSKIKSKRRLALTGTPLQNNLMEYQCMVNFVKPNLLGSVKEFRNRFVNPIQNGQHSDSTPRDVRLMKKRCHVLHNMLQGFVQRKDYTALSKYLCDKYEYIIKVRLAPVQVELYRNYLDTQTNRGSNPNAIIQGSRDTGLFADYQSLMRIWTHPRVLRLHTIRQEHANQFLNDESSEEEELPSSEEETDEDEAKKKRSPSPTVNGHVIVDSDAEVTEAKRKRKKKKLRLSDDSSASGSETNEDCDDENDDDDDDDESCEEVTITRRTRRGGRYRLRGGNSDSNNSDDDDDNKENGEAGDSYDDDSWYSSIYKENPEAFDNIESGGKLTVLFEILYQAKLCDDKVLVFSQSLLSLDLIEEMLALSTAKLLSLEEANESADGTIYQKWYKNVDYYRIDGSSMGKTRQKYINQFNDEEDRRARLFLISTKAGSLGVNLVAANRVVIFDASWNPTHDIQSIFRVYRFGQTKACYIYRLIAQGTMEEKIYDRQITKQSLSFRVVDEQQINRYFTAHDLQELYNFNPSPIPKEGEPGPTHVLPKDKLLAELLVGDRTKNLISSYHKHDSLLDHQETEELTEEERKAAWEEYEKEKMGYRAPPPTSPSTSSFPPPGASGSNSNFINKLQGFYRNQMILQQQRLQQMHETAKAKEKSSSLAQRSQSSQQQSPRDRIFSMILQVSESIIATKNKLEELRPTSIQDMIENLRKMPMYSAMKDEGLRLVAFEIKLQRHQTSLSLQSHLKKLQLQLRWLNSKYQNFTPQPFLPHSASSPAFASSSSKEAENNRKPTIDASSFARAAFADMIESCGVNSDVINAKTEAKQKTKDQAPTEESNAGAVEAKQKTKDQALTEESNADAVEAKQKTKEAPTEANNESAVDLSKRSSSEVKPMTLSVLLNNVYAGSSVTSADSKTFKIAKSQSVVIPPKLDASTRSDAEAPPKANSRALPSKTKNPTKKAEASDSSEDDDVITDEEEDWEAMYLKNAKKHSRRTRNR